MAPTRLLDPFHRAAACAAAVAAIAMLPASPAEAGSIYSTSCSHGFGYSYGRGWGSGYGSGGCVEMKGRLVNPYVIEVPPPRSEKEIADAAERDRLWQARCKPVVRQDHYGVRRYHYAVPDCEYGPYE
jgi:hypothetical protein